MGKVYLTLLRKSYLINLKGKIINIGYTASWTKMEIFYNFPFFNNFIIQSGEYVKPKG